MFRGDSGPRVVTQNIPTSHHSPGNWPLSLFWGLTVWAATQIYLAHRAIRWSVGHSSEWPALPAMIRHERKPA